MIVTEDCSVEHLHMNAISGTTPKNRKSPLKAEVGSVFIVTMTSIVKGGSGQFS